VASACVGRVKPWAENNAEGFIPRGLTIGRKIKKMVYLSSPTLLWSWLKQTVSRWWTFRAARRAPKFRFTRYDGVAFELDCMNCPQCKNYWFVRRVLIEIPPFCPYCGVRFEGVALIPNVTMNEHQV
jgi:ribosomal protein L37AE/L43A